MARCRSPQAMMIWLIYHTKRQRWGGQDTEHSSHTSCCKPICFANYTHNSNATPFVAEFSDWRIWNLLPSQNSTTSSDYQCSWIWVTTFAWLLHAYLFSTSLVDSTQVLHLRSVAHSLINTCCLTALLNPCWLSWQTHLNAIAFFGISHLVP